MRGTGPWDREIEHSQNFHYQADWSKQECTVSKCCSKLLGTFATEFATFQRRIGKNWAPDALREAITKLGIFFIFSGYATDWTYAQSSKHSEYICIHTQCTAASGIGKSGILVL